MLNDILNSEIYGNGNMDRSDMIESSKQANADDIQAAAPKQIFDILKRGVSASPRNVALSQGEERITFEHLNTLVLDFASALNAEGVGPGDRVCIVFENSIDAVALFFAVSKCEAAIVPINARLTEREMNQVLHEADARLVLFIVRGSKDAQEHAQRHPGGVSLFAGRDGVLSSTSRAASEAFPSTERPERTPALLLFTSGSTGSPKAVMHSAPAIGFIAQAYAMRRKVVEKDRVYCVLPLSHVFGLSSLLMPFILSGARVDLQTRFEPVRVAAALAAGKYTRFFAVPVMYAALVQQFLERGDRPRQLKEITTGGAPLDPKLKADVEQIFGLPLQNGYGATEITPMASDDGTVGDESVGQSAPGVQLKLVNATGADAQTGETGEVWARGPALMLGYFRAPEATAAVMRPGGWYATGDLGVIDEDGRLRIVGRAKDVIIRSGFNVYPLEVEAALNSHNDVSQSAVIGAPRGQGDETVAAFVEVREGSALSASELRDFARSVLTGYKCPEHLVLVDRLPVGASGKIDKINLRGRLKTLLGK